MTHNILTIPNIISLSRLVLAWPLALAVYNESMVTAVILGSIAIMTDFLDGYLARSFNQLSKLGKILDPIADKLLITCALISLISNNIIQDIHVIASTLIIILFALLVRLSCN